MKKRILTQRLAAAALAIGCVAALPIVRSQESSNKGKIEIEIDPGSAGFDAKEIEESIRRMAQNLNLSDEHQKQLEDALKQLKDNLKPGADGKAQKFNWKWEYQNDGAKPKSKGGAQPQPQPQPNRGGAGDGSKGYDKWLERMKQLMEKGGSGGNAEEMMRELFGGDFDPQKMMQEMMKRMGEGGGQPFQLEEKSPDGSKRYFFRFGPGGLEQQNEPGGEQPNRGAVPLQMFGGRDHDYDPDKAPRDSKYSRATLAEYRGCVKDARHFAVSVLQGGSPVSLGTVVTANGYALSKSSELRKDQVEVEFMDGRILPAKVVDRVEAYDLALLKIDGKDLAAAKFSEQELPVGSTLVAAGIDEDPISVGVASVAPRNLDESQKGFLGLALDESKDGGVLVRTVVQGSPAEKAKIEAGDLVISVNGQEVNRAQDLMKIISSKAPGDTVKLRIKSGAGEEEVDVTLTSREEGQKSMPRGIDPTARMGSDLSGKSSGFPNAMQNDLGINADQCGGPVVNIDGAAVGINIARAGRTSTYMLTAKVLHNLLNGVESGKLNFTKDPGQLDREIGRFEAELKAAEEQMKKVQERLKAAREAREKAGKQ